MGVTMMKLFIKEYGNKKGNLMVFLHGGGVSSWMWDRQFLAFTDYHCLAVDLPEHGKSSDSGPFTIRSTAKEVEKIIVNFKNDRKVIVIGFSLGAQVLVELLAMDPDLIDYAVINSGSVTPVRGIKTLIKPSIYLSFPLVHIKSFAKLQAKKLYIDREHFDQYFEESRNMKKEALIRVLEESMTYTLPASYSNSSGKILVTAGALEVGAIKKSYQLLINQNPNSTGHIFPNIGHGAPLAIPDEFNQAIKEWLYEKTKASLGI